MIQNLPNSDNFKQIARNCLIQTINNLYQIFESYQFSENAKVLDFEEEELWQYHKGDLRTCLMLVYQGLELYLKSVICEESPLLLIETSRTDWPTNPSSNDRDFNELYTLTGESLIRTFNALPLNGTDKDVLNTVFDRIRKKRNVITHSSPNFTIAPDELIKDAVLILSTFEGNDKWWTLIKENNVDHPLFGYGDYDYELANLILRLEFIKKKSGIGYLNKYSTINLRSRSYLCPNCTRYLGDLGFNSNDVPKWSFLSPNTSTSKTVLCFSCQQNFNIERVKCTNEVCKGNVIDIENRVCLTCFEEYDEDLDAR